MYRVCDTYSLMCVVVDNICNHGGCWWPFYAHTHCIESFLNSTIICSWLLAWVYCGIPSKSMLCHCVYFSSIERVRKRISYPQTCVKPFALKPSLTPLAICKIDSVGNQPTAYVLPYTPPSGIPESNCSQCTIHVQLSPRQQCALLYCWTPARIAWSDIPRLYIRVSQEEPWSRQNWAFPRLSFFPSFLVMYHHGDRLRHLAKEGSKLSSVSPSPIRHYSFCSSATRGGS